MGWLRDLFRLRWEQRGNGFWYVCPDCEGAGEVDLSTGLPIGPREQNANAVECSTCTGMGRKWRPL